jgi:hypothetical protein
LICPPNPGRQREHDSGVAGFGKSSRRAAGMGKCGRRFHSRKTGEAGQSRVRPSESKRAERFPGNAQRRAETVEPASGTPAFQVDPSKAEEAIGLRAAPAFLK